MQLYPAVYQIDTLLTHTLAPYLLFQYFLYCFRIFKHHKAKILQNSKSMLVFTYEETC